MLRVGQPSAGYLMLKPIARVSRLALALCLLPGLNARAVSLSIELASMAVDLGDPVELSILVSGLGDGSAPSLGVYSFDVEFGATGAGRCGVFDAFVKELGVPKTTQIDAVDWTRLVQVELEPDGSRTETPLGIRVRVSGLHDPSRGDLEVKIASGETNHSATLVVPASEIGEDCSFVAGPFDDVPPGTYLVTIRAQMPGRLLGTSAWATIQ